jgi:hypothetical protein
MYDMHDCAMPEVDYQALGFALTTPDVADILNKNESEVHDLVRTGSLPCLVKADSPMGLLRMWFHPDDVSYIEVRLRETSARTSLHTDHLNRLRVQAALRAYLAAVPPTEDYDDALLRNAPLFGSTRRRARRVHVRAEAVAAFGSTLDSVPVTTSMVRAALEYFGAIRVRGVTAAAEPGTQRWGTWFRLPEGFDLGEADENSVIRGVVAGGYEPGERVSRRREGAAYLAEPLKAAADSPSVD